MLEEKGGYKTVVLTKQICDGRLDKFNESTTLAKEICGQIKQLYKDVGKI
jgi:hypothetical protein